DHFAGDGSISLGSARAMPPRGDAGLIRIPGRAHAYSPLVTPMVISLPVSVLILTMYWIPGTNGKELTRNCFDTTVPSGKLPDWINAGLRTSSARMKAAMMTKRTVTMRLDSAH